jgi:VanZ family protein
MSSSEKSAAKRIRRYASHARVIAAAYFVALFVGTHLPPGEISTPDISDKLAHFIGYAGLATLILAVWELSIGKLQPRHYFAVWLAGVAYGAFDEWTQIPVGRTCDMNDWAADVVGVTSGIIIYRLLRPILFAITGHDDGSPNQ